MRVRWYPTDLPCITGTSIINNRVFDPQPWAYRPLGEVPRWMRQYKQLNAWTPPPGLKGNHLCHPEWIQTGEPWPTDLPDTQYDSAWIPTCCGRLVDPLAGGIEIGGSAGDVFTAPPGPTCTLAAEGDFNILYTRPTVPGVEQWWKWPVAQGQAYTGHVTWVSGATNWIAYLASGACPGIQIFSGIIPGNFPFTSFTDGYLYVKLLSPAFVATYGVKIDGAPPHYHSPTAGGVQIGGSAGDVFDPGPAPTGGVQIGGSAGDVLRPPDLTDGGVQIGGSAGDVAGAVDATEGGIELGGEAGDVFTPGDLPEGGIEVGGEAGDVFTPGTAYCIEYLLTDFPGQVLRWDNPFGSPDRIWWSADGSYRLDSPLQTGTIWILYYWAGAERWHNTGWDGTGTGSFTLVVGTGPDPTDVVSTC